MHVRRWHMRCAQCKIYQLYGLLYAQYHVTVSVLDAFCHVTKSVPDAFCHVTKSVPDAFCQDEPVVPLHTHTHTHTHTQIIMFDSPTILLLKCN